MIKLALGCQANVGKSTIAHHLTSKYNFVEYAFSEPLYNIMYYAQRMCGFDQQKDREFLQYVGTEWARKRDPNVWINYLMNQVVETNTNIVVSDVRFKNEFDTLKNNGFTMIRIIRDISLLNHSSEIELMNKPLDEWDYIIYNNGDVDTLYENIHNILQDHIL